MFMSSQSLECLGLHDFIILTTSSSLTGLINMELGHCCPIKSYIEAALSATVIFLSRLEPTSTKKLLNPSAMLCLLTILISLHSKWLGSLDVLVYLLIIVFSIFHVLLMFPFASVNNLE